MLPLLQRHIPALAFYFRGAPSGPSGECARPPAGPGSCARNWSSDGATGQPLVEHLASGAGFFNLIRIYPTRGIGVAVTGNVTLQC
jgi:hypothetical protein